MTEALTQLRENGDIPWNWIVDETRSLKDYSGPSTITEGVLDRLPFIKLDPWHGDVPLILTESRSLAGCLYSVASEYGILIAPTNGQVGGFLHTDIAPTLHAESCVLYLGDLDLCGGDIENNTRHVLEREVGELKWERLALTEEQATSHNLPRITKTDRRFKGGGGVPEAVETEALSLRIIIDIVRSRLEVLLPEPLQSVQQTRRTRALRPPPQTRRLNSDPMDLCCTNNRRNASPKAAFTSKRARIGHAAGFAPHFASVFWDELRYACVTAYATLSSSRDGKPEGSVSGAAGVSDVWHQVQDAISHAGQILQSCMSCTLPPQDGELPPVDSERARGPPSNHRSVDDVQVVWQAIQNAISKAIEILQPCVRIAMASVAGNLSQVLRQAGSNSSSMQRQRLQTGFCPSGHF